MDHIIIAPDNRFKRGSIKRKGNVLRGHPETLDMQTYRSDTLSMKLFPPIVVSRELGAKIKSML